jgi:DNA-binding transcriptional regulator LsrR (DeoR family)
MVKVTPDVPRAGTQQAQIASELHITQARVSRLLRRAADAGIVKRWSPHRPVCTPT